MADTYPIPPPSPPPAAPAPEVPKARETKSRSKPGKRLVSLDAYRGFIMMMLAASGFGIAKLASLNQDNSVWKTWDYDTFQRLKFHFDHPPWESISGMMGVSFWDMIQPCFMFMVGVAMPFSYARRSAMGSSSFWRGLHALWRALLLMLMGVFLYSLSQPQTNWIFTNVLAQIGLGYFFAYLTLGWKAQGQLAALAVILVGYWGLFIMNPPPDNFDYAAVNASTENGEIYEGRFAPWSKNANVGHFVDLWLLNKLRMPATTDTDGNPDANGNADKGWTPGYIRQWWFSSPDTYTNNQGGYVTLNFIPSIATTLLGILCGQLLLSRESSSRKILQMLMWGGICVALGILAHHSVCPIVKRIWTPSWVLFSGGYAIWMLAAFFFLFDVLPLRKLAFPLVVVGMNSIVMYMMGQMLRPWVTEKIVKVHLGGVLRTFFGPDALNTGGMGAIIVPTAVFAVFWLIAWWLYRNRYFVRV